MLSAVKQIPTGTEDWKSEFLKSVSRKMDEILEDYQMDSITDISKSLFQNRSEIMGKAAFPLGPVGYSL